MISQLPQSVPELPLHGAPLLLTVYPSRWLRVDANRMIALRLIAQGLLAPDTFVDLLPAEVSDRPLSLQ
jgi:hypothetical protein